jgi:hypothetical protein
MCIVPIVDLIFTALPRAKAQGQALKMFTALFPSTNHGDNVWTPSTTIGMLSTEQLVSKLVNITATITVEQEDS